MKSILVVLISLVITGFMAAFVSTSLETSYAGTYAVLFVISLVPQVPAGAMGMALDVEIWKDIIIPNLFTNNEFLSRSVDASEHVINGKIVHIPQAGSPSGVVKNRDTLPAQVSIRGDRDVTYVIDEFTTNPRLLPNADKILSYDKYASMTGEDMMWLRQVIASHMLYHWRNEASSDFIVRTTGSAVAAHLASATGNRKAFKIANLQEAAARMDEQGVPMVGRVALFSARMLKQLKDELTSTQYRDYVNGYDPKMGIIGKLEGFDIMSRASVLRADNSSTPAILTLDDVGSPVGAGAADNDVILCWADSMVERAVGDVNPFYQENNPLYYGDLFSLLVNMGGRKRRDDGKGVIAIIQDSAT